jgi:hypothetical protein
MLKDDIFVIAHEIITSIPTGVSGLLGMLLVSILLAWLKWYHLSFIILM